MASTFEQAEAALRDYQAAMGRIQERRWGFVNELKAIDLTSPTAISQYDDIGVRYDSTVDSDNTEITRVLAVLNSIVDNLPPDGIFSSAKADFKKKVAATRGEIIKLQQASNREFYNVGKQVGELKKAAEQKTKTAESVPAENKDQAAPATNDDAGAKPPETSDENSTTKTPSNPGTVVNNASNSKTSPTRSNPLANLSSYTYGLSLYMVNTDVMNRFVASGGTMVGITGASPGVRVVARSGGFSDSDRTLRGMSIDKNPDGARIDYYIDDLEIVNVLPGGPQKATVGTEIKFKIIEPIGFAFLQDLARAGQILNEQSNVKAPNMNGIQQHFIIGVKFYGYDVNGNVITQIPTNSKGGTTTPGQLPEKYFVIRLTDVKFKLDGKIVTYQCDAVVLAESVANGQVNGLVKSTTTLTGSTVWDVLADPVNKTSLVSVLNASTEADKDSNRVKIPITYVIEFLDSKGTNVGKNSNIAKQKMINDATFDSALAKTVTISDAEKATIAQQFKAVTIDGTTASIPLSRGQHILTVIDNVITKSEYITESLNQISNTRVETQVKTNTPLPFRWYSVNPVVTAKDYDPRTNDWSYEIKFQISEYEVSYLRTVNATKLSKYPGPSKRYEYWLTGNNSEIISYEQRYDNLYYVMTVATRSPAPDSNNDAGNTRVKTQAATGADSNGSENRQFQFNENVVAQMYSPGDQGEAKIKITGDPDYIMTRPGVNYTQPLGNTGIDPLKGQVFIEIKFLMATDYEANGVLNISDKIQFQSEQVTKELNIDAVVYRVTQVDSVFSKGAFSQTLTCVLVDLGLLGKNGTSNNTGGTTNNNGSSGGNTSSSSYDQRSESDEEILARRRAYGRSDEEILGGLSDEEILARRNRIGATISSSSDTRKASIISSTSTNDRVQQVNSKNSPPSRQIKNEEQSTSNTTAAKDDQNKNTQAPKNVDNNRTREGR